MPILKGSLDNVPKDTVRLSESDAIDYQEKMMDCWEPSYEMWPLKYGSVFLAGACGASVFATSEKFRKLCFLAKYSRLMIGIPTATLTSLGVLLLQSKFVTEDFLLAKTLCTSCVQTRSAMFQGFLGSIYPTFLVSCGSALFAQSLSSNLVPRAVENPSKFIKFCQQMLRQNGTFLAGVCIVQVALAFIVTDLQMESAFKLNRPVTEIEETKV